MNISNTNEYFFSDILHMYLLQSSHESFKGSSGSNSKWPTYCPFCLLKLTKYLKMSIRMNISNTNEHFLPILYTCINYNPPMNPVQFRLEQIDDLLPFLLSQIDKIFENLSVRMNISQTNAYLFPIIYTCIYYNPFMNPYSLQQSFYLVEDTIVLAYTCLYFNIHGEVEIL